MHRSDSMVYVVYVSRNTWHEIVLGLACQAAGFVEAPIDCGGGPAYIDACMDRLRRCTDIELLRLDESEVRSLTSAGTDSETSLSAPASTDDALLLWTGGTTGDSRGVLLSHASLFANAAAKLQAVPQTTEDLRLTLLSISHAYARTSDVGTWLLSGCRLAIGRGMEGWETFKRLKPTLVNAVPSLLDRLIHADPDHLKLVGCGGAAMTESAFSLWTLQGATVIQGYGLTETGPVICSQTPNNSVPGRVGGFVSGWEHRLESARLLVRGPHLMTRYFDDPLATRNAFDEQGWFETGDLVRWDDSCQQLEILGRQGDRISLSNGYTVDPVAIENRYRSLAEVRTAIVTAATNARRLELWIEWQGDTPADLSTLTASLARWQQPQRIHEFRLPEPLRRQWTNRKGTLRRKPVLQWLIDSNRS